MVKIVKIPSRVAIWFIVLYQATLSHWIGRQCRFIPTCSNYCIEAIEQLGLLKGGIKGIWRILRCNPFCKGGYDPVKK